jgi:hypothetical protein
LTATFCASPAHLHTLVHVADLLAALRACVAYFRACCTDARVQLRIAQHEIGCRATDLGAINHETEMHWLDVLAAGFQTVVHRFVQARLIALKTFLNTLLHLWVRLMCHGLTPSERACACSVHCARDGTEGNLHSMCRPRYDMLID